MSFSLVRVSAALVFGCIACTSAAPCLAQGSRLLGNPQVAPLGLETMWSTFVRVDPARGHVASLKLMHGLLIGQTDQGTIQAIDPESGRTLWTTTVGSPHYLTMAPSANDKFVAVTNGTTLYLLDRATGSVQWEQRVSGSPSAGTAMNDTRVYVPLDTGIVEAYLLVREQGRELFDSIPKRYTGSSGAVEAPLVVGKRANWSVSSGFVYSSEETFKDLVQFRVRTDDNLSVGPAYMQPFLFAAARSGTVYALDGVTGSEIWRASIGNSVSHPLITVDGALYVISELGDMVRFDPRVGRQLWFARGVRRFVSASSDRVYVLDIYNRLSARDAATGSPYGAVPTAGFDLPSVNTESDRIILASSTGLVQCLRESRNLQPIRHQPGDAVPQPKKPGEPDAPATDTAPMPGDPVIPAAPNPFGN